MSFNFCCTIKTFYFVVAIHNTPVKGEERKLSMKKCFALVLALVVAMSLVSCSASGNSTSGNDSNTKELTVYFSFTDDEIPTYIKAFEEDTGIHINYVRLSAGEVISRIMAEKDNPQASLIINGSSIIASTAANEGLIEPYVSSNIDKIPEAYRDPNGNWTPLNVAAHVFLCNNEWFAENKLEKPHSWEDLLNPGLKDMVMMAHPSSSGVAASMLVNMLQYKGEEDAWKYFGDLSEILPYFCKASSAGPSAVCLGEAAVALCLDADAMKYKIQGYDVDIVYPEPTFVDVNVVAMIKNGPADEVENAKTFIDWMISERAQNLYIESGSCRLPVNVDANVVDGLSPIGDLTVFQKNDARAIEEQTPAIEEFMARIDDATALG